MIATSDRTLFDAVPDGLLVFDPATSEIQDVNDAFLELLAYDREQLVGQTLADISADNQSNTLSKIRDKIEQTTERDSHQFELRLKASDNTAVPAEIRLSAVRCDGEQQVLASVRTITGRKEYEQKYRTAKRHLDAILDATEFGLFLKNTDHEYILMNRRVKEMFGLEKLQPGTTDYDLVPDATAEKFQQDDRQVIETEESLRTEEEVPEKGGIRTYLTIKIPVYDENGELYGIGGFTQDITEKKERQRQLEETKRQLEQSNEKLEQFAYVASHDLQEPLRMISSYLDLLEAELAGELDEETREFLEYALDGAERMQAMIDGLLEYSRVQTRADPFEDVDPNAVLTDTLQDLELKLDDSAVTVETAEMPAVTADANQLGQVFQNLIKNAVEHRRAGSDITVRVTATKQDDKTEFSVTDTGPGIDEDRQEKIFDLFNSGTDSDGTGIGLAVCQQIIDRHGGEIWVDSTPGEGTTVSFTIPDYPG